MCGTDPSGVEGRERRRGVKRLMRMKTGMGTGCGQRARASRTRLRAPARAPDTTVHEELREVCWQHPLPIRGVILRWKMGSSYAPALLSSRDCSSRGSSPRADRTPSPACVGTPECMDLAPDYGERRLKRSPLLRGSDTLGRRGSPECESRTLGVAVRIPCLLPRVQRWAGRPDVPDPLPRVAQWGYLVSIQGEDDFAPVP